MRWVKEVFLNFKRSGFMSLISIGTIVITITMLGGYFIIHQGLDYFITKIENRMEVVVFLKDSADEGAMGRLADDARGFSNVKEVKTVTKWDAYGEFCKDSEMKEILEGFEENPLPASIVIKLKDYTQKSIKEIADFFRASEGVDEVKYGAGHIENLINLLNAIRLTAAAAGVIFVIASLLVVSNIIKLTIYARRQDIYIFRMVGATGVFIRMPFIFEGIVHGLIGGLLGWGVLYAVVKLLAFEIKKDIGLDITSFYIFEPFYFYVKFLAASVGAGMILGLLGALFSQGRIEK